MSPLFYFVLKRLAKETYCLFLIIQMLMCIAFRVEDLKSILRIYFSTCRFFSVLTLIENIDLYKSSSIAFDLHIKVI